jgi:AbrB family looped-hinge helix DNA binding protein
MRTTVDKAGRLVIPRALRNRIGLGAGGEVDIEVDGAGLRIELITGAELREVEGLLIISAPGLLIDDALVRDLVDQDRYKL